ncbi:hypothetical protein IAT38_001705 [Cryptococcus sp. DSM 104549]
MGLQRTPPQRVNRLSPNPPAAGEAVSPFLPRNPGVRRSPPAGSPAPPSSFDAAGPSTLLAQSTSARPEAPTGEDLPEEPAAEHVEEDDEEVVPRNKSLIVDERPIKPAPTIVIQEETMVVDEVDESADVSVAKVAEDVDMAEAEVEGHLAVEPEPHQEAEPGVAHPSELHEVVPAAAASSSKRSREPSPAHASSIPSEASSSSQPPPPPKRARPSHAAPPPPPPAPAQDPVTPAPKTPRSRSRRQTNPLPAPPAPLRMGDEAEVVAEGRYELTMRVLEKAVTYASQRWTADDFKECFPTLAKKMPKAMENTWLSASQAMHQNIRANVHELLDHYKFAPALQAIDEVDQEAREYAQEHPAVEGMSSRPDGWRAELSPYALVAATNLPIYDEAYAKLREEYIELHKDCSDRYGSILAKQAALKDLNESVGDGVVDLEKAIKTLEELPVEDMMVWSEAVETKMDTRAPDLVE